MQEARVLHGGGTDHHVAHAHVQVALDGVQRADATAQLHRHLGPHGINDGSDHACILRLAGKGAIQVHQVDALGALVAPASGHFGRVFGKDRLLVEFALFETDTTAVLQIDRGNQQHGSNSRAAQGRQWMKFRKRRRPLAALFSG